MMMSIMMAMVLSMAPAKADPIDVARKAFNNCLVEVHNTGVSDKMSASKFNETIAAACTEQRTNYRNLVYKAELGYGSKAAEASQFADEETQTIVDSVTSAFGDNVDSGAKLQPEK
jgi:hypothetical protein